MTVQNAHDRFFRESFGRLHIARNYLQEYLPHPVLALLDLDTLALQDGSFIDEEMQEHQKAAQPPSTCFLSTRAIPTRW
jgi:hypothetical protein